MTSRCQVGICSRALYGLGAGLHGRLGARGGAGARLESGGPPHKRLRRPAKPLVPILHPLGGFPWKSTLPLNNRTLSGCLSTLTRATTFP